MFFSKHFIELSEVAQLAKNNLSVACSTDIAMIVNYAAIGVIYNGSVLRNFVVQQASAFAVVSHSLLVLTNTLAFYVTELIKAVISFMIQAPGANVIELLRL